ncbi:MAG: hypothetical protein ACLFS3_02265 [Candidatus Aenigmatarchaeota archaeon]
MKQQKIFSIFIILLFAGSVVAYAVNFASSSQGNQNKREARALLRLRICGEERDIPETTKQLDGFTFQSNSSGIISFPLEDDVELGQVFDWMNVSFSRSGVMGYKNEDDACNTTYSNEVSVWTGKEDQQLQRTKSFRSYRVENGDVILVRYD